MRFYPILLALVAGSTQAQVTPDRIDRLAAEGVRFERVRAASPWTLPSLTSMRVSVSGTSFRHTMKFMLPPSKDIGTLRFHPAGP